MVIGAVVVFLIALILSRFINWAIYSWAYYSRKIGPWAPAVEGDTRRWSDHLPIFGWFQLRREVGKTDKHTKRFWLRPLLIELLFPVCITAYYCLYISGFMLPVTLRSPEALASLFVVLHYQFGGHFVLFTLMMIATFIDFDEHSIPDLVTIPGAVIGLVGALFAPGWLPCHATPLVGPTSIIELHVGAPGDWPEVLGTSTGFILGLAILAIWGFALLDRVWITRRGLKKAFQYYFAYLVRRRKIWLTVLIVTWAMMLMTCLAYRYAYDGRWPVLLSSLIGMAAAAGITWGVRVSASVGLGVEALGFGDVTLMAMIGTYIGWQPSLLVFFIAPLVAVLIVLVRWVITRETVTPYGPYLCAATVIILVGWDFIWFNWAAKFFSLGPTIGGIIVACVALMGVMLWIWRLIKQALGIAGH